MSPAPTRFRQTTVYLTGTREMWTGSKPRRRNKFARFPSRSPQCNHTATAWRTCGGHKVRTRCVTRRMRARTMFKPRIPKHLGELTSRSFLPLRFRSEDRNNMCFSESATAAFEPVEDKTATLTANGLLAGAGRSIQYVLCSEI